MQSCNKSVKTGIICWFLQSEKLLQSESVHIYLVSPIQKEKHRQWIIWTILLLLQQKKEATIGMELDQQSARRNSKFSIRAAENSASICMTNRTFVQGHEGRMRLKGHTSWEGYCHSAISQPRTLQRSAKHSSQKVRAKRVGATRAALEKDAQNLKCVCAKGRTEGNKKQHEVAQTSMVLIKHKNLLFWLRRFVVISFSSNKLNTHFVLHNLGRLQATVKYLIGTKWNVFVTPRITKWHEPKAGIRFVILLSYSLMVDLIKLLPMDHNWHAATGEHLQLL